MHTLLRRYPDISTVFLLVGQGGVYARPTAVQTVLGSCVTVTFHCPGSGVGAAFHALMPQGKGQDRSGNPPNPFYYVDTAIRSVFDDMISRGANKRKLECKVFGGASAMFPQERSVGAKNTETAFRVLEELRVRVKGYDVGGEMGRKLLFISHTGEVFMRRIRQSGSEITKK